MDRGAWWATIHGITESDTTEHTHTAPLYCPHLFCSVISVRCALSVPSPWISSLTSMMSLLHFIPPLGLILCSHFSKAHLLFINLKYFYCFKLPRTALYLKNLYLYWDLSPEFLNCYLAICCAFLLRCPDDFSTCPTSSSPSLSSTLPQMNLLSFF